MKSSDDLFQLIKSMSKSEKGYFKKYASKHTIGEQNTYVRLFDAIDDLEEYNEHLLKARFKGEKFAEKIYSIKNYLFNLILKALSSYHSEKFAVSKLNNMLTELNVLFEKGLYKQFKTLLNKAIGIALENDKPFYLALLYNKAMTFVATGYYSETGDFDFEKLKKPLLENLDKLKEIEGYHILYNEMFLFTKKRGSIRNEDDLKKLDGIINNPLLKDGRNAGTFDSKFKYYNILGHYYRITGDKENWMKYRKDLMILMESDKKYIRENPRSYILALNNYINACVITENNREFELNLKKLKQFAKQFENKKEYIDIQTRVFMLISDLELNHSIKTLKPENTNKIIHEIELGFKKFGSKIAENRKTSLYNRMAYSSFINKDFDKCILFINKIMNSTDPKVEPEQHAFARIINLIAHFESGNFDLLEYSIKSTKRFLQKANRIYKFEKIILDFISRAMNYGNEKERTKLYQKLKDDVAKISNDKFERNVIEQFDLTAWIESKIRSSSMLDILKQKKAA